MIVFPNAKINIGLYITRKREDGYHDIVTAMVPVDWCDILEIVPARGEETTLTVSGRDVACPPDKNLVMRAYRAVAERYDLPPVDIYLRKIIPDGAGLGGGSADASFTIRALNELFHLGLSDAAMAEIASTIGSDCPFFIYNRPMLATGTGTTMEPIEVDLHGYSVAVVKPDVYVSTAEAYGGCHPHQSGIDLPQVLLTTPVAKWMEAGVRNDFEDTVFPRHPAIAAVKATLQDLGSEYVAMSGSGAGVFGIFGRDILADEIAKALPGTDVYVAKL